MIQRESVLPSSKTNLPYAFNNKLLYCVCVLIAIIVRQLFFQLQKCLEGGKYQQILGYTVEIVRVRSNFPVFSDGDLAVFTNHLFVLLEI